MAAETQEETGNVPRKKDVERALDVITSSLGAKVILPDVESPAVQALREEVLTLATQSLAGFKRDLRSPNRSRQHLARSVLLSLVYNGREGLLPIETTEEPTGERDGNM